MISAIQREALAVLTELCEMSTDVRLGQLFAHLGFLGQDQTGRSFWDIDDDQLLAVLYFHRDELSNRSAQTPVSAVDLAGILVDCVEGPGELATKPKLPDGFGE